MNKSYLESMPDANGFFGKFGGSFIPPELEKPFEEIKKAYEELNTEISEVCSGMPASKQQKIQRIISKAMSLASFRPENRKESTPEEDGADMHGNKVKSMFKNLKLK